MGHAEAIVAELPLLARPSSTDAAARVVVVEVVISVVISVVVLVAVMARVPVGVPVIVLIRWRAPP